MTTAGDSMAAALPSPAPTAQTPHTVPAASAAPAVSAVLAVSTLGASPSVSPTMTQPRQPPSEASQDAARSPALSAAPATQAAPASAPISNPMDTSTTSAAQKPSPKRAPGAAPPLRPSPPAAIPGPVQMLQHSQHAQHAQHAQYTQPSQPARPVQNTQHVQHVQHAQHAQHAQSTVHQQQQTVPSPALAPARMPGPRAAPVAQPAPQAWPASQPSRAPQQTHRLSPHMHMSNGTQAPQPTQSVQQPHADRRPGRPRISDPTFAHRAPIINPPREAACGVSHAAAANQPSVDSAPRAASYPSPMPTLAHENPKFQDDYLRITYALEQSLPESVRCAIRENWQKCLIGSVFHHEFLLNALLTNITPDIAQRVMTGYGEALVHMAPQETMQHMNQEDIDKAMASILNKASNRFLDAALERRLRTIDAKPLINALARAGRLGYEPEDIVEEAPANGQERVVPQESAHAGSPPVGAPPSAVPGGAGWQCKVCNRVFESESAYFYHIHNRVCMQRPPDSRGFKYSCSKCGQGFNATHDLYHHDSNNVCLRHQVARTGTYSSDQAAAINGGRVMSDAGVPTANPSVQSKAGPSFSTPVRRTYDGASMDSAGYQSVPARMPLRQASPNLTPRPSNVHGDPYAHLTEQKLAELQEALRTVERQYAERFREAEQIIDPVERRNRVDGLKNSFGTRQSIVRKKFGVRLRERRTRAEIEAEKVRLGIATPKDGSPAPMSGAAENDMYATSVPPSRPANGANGTNGTNGTNGYSNGSYAKRARTDGFLHDRATAHEDREPLTELRRKTPPQSLADKGPGHIQGPGVVEAAAAALALSLSQSTARQGNNDNMSDSSSDDDIPARLPDAVRQSLSSSQL